MKIQIFIEADITLRHFLLSGVLQELEGKNEIQYVFANYKKRLSYNISTLNLKNIKMIDVDVERVTKIRQLSKIETIVRSRTNDTYSFVPGMWKKLLGVKPYYVMKFYSLPIINYFYKKKIINSVGGYPEMEKAINEFSPDLIIHPSVLEGLFINDLCQITKIKKIPFLVLMNSWDNPSTKAFVLEKPDWLCVWGPQTKQHAIEFLGMNSENVFTIGSAQFDVYKKTPEVCRDDICQMLNIDPKTKIIIYAGSSKSINEMTHLRILNQSVKDGALKDSVIVFRPHPWRDPSGDDIDFYDMNLEFVKMDPFIKDFYIGPKTKPEDRKINLTRYEDTHSILSSADLLISNVSTILVESIIHGVPAICMISDADVNKSDFLSAVLETRYFSELFQNVDIPRCFKYEEVANVCNLQLKKYADDDQKIKLREQAGYFVNLDSQKYADKLEDIIKKHIVAKN